MKHLKKLVAIIMLIALMVPTSAFAATASPTKIDASKAVVKLSHTTHAYFGKNCRPAATVTLNKKVLKRNVDYTATYQSATKNVGTYRVTIKFIGKYTGPTKYATYKVLKANQSGVKVYVKNKTHYAKTFKNYSKSYDFKVTGVKGKAPVKYTTSSRKVTVKNGKITFAKGISSGTYTVKVYVAPTKNYKSYTKTITFKIIKAKQSSVKVSYGKSHYAKTFKNAAKSFDFKVSGVKGGAKVTYKTSSSKVTVKNGKITFAKGIKKGTYKVTVKTASTKYYSSSAKTVKITIK